MDKSRSIFVFVSSQNHFNKFLQKAKEKTLLQLISLATLKVFDYFTLLRYRIQYPNLKLGSGVTIRGKFSIKGKGQVEIGNNCFFISFDNNSNTIYVEDSSARLTIADNCFFKSTTFLIEGKGQVEVGEHCYFNGTTIQSVDFVEFKRHCLVSDAWLVDTDFHSIQINRRDPNVHAKTKPICVGENAWIGSQSMILKGVTIGKNSVIGAGTVVRQSVPENVVVIGNPQQIVKELDTTVLPYEFPQVA